MPKALVTQPTEGLTLRVIAQERAGGQGKPSKLRDLQNDNTFKSWKVGQALDFYDDICKYDGVAEVINKLIGGAYLSTKQKAPLTSAIGAVQRELRKALKQDPYSTKNGDGSLTASVRGSAKESIQVVEKDGKIESIQYVLWRKN